MSTSLLKSKLSAVESMLSSQSPWGLPEHVLVLSTWCPVNCPVNLPGMYKHVCSLREKASEQECWKHSLPFLKTHCLVILSFPFSPKACRNFPIIPQSKICLIAECVHSQHLRNGHYFSLMIWSMQLMVMMPDQGGLIGSVAFLKEIILMELWTFK